MYEGEWTRGIQHGIGRMVFPDGQAKEGYFENNVFKYGIGGGNESQLGINSQKSLNGIHPNSNQN